MESIALLLAIRFFVIILLSTNNWNQEASQTSHTSTSSVQCSLTTLMFHRIIKRIYVTTQPVKTPPSCSVLQVIGRPTAGIVCVAERCPPGVCLSHYNLGALNKAPSCYNKCITLFGGGLNVVTVLQVLTNLGLPGFDTVLANATASFMRLWSSCNNHIQLKKSFPILVTERWARSWSRCTGSQPAGDVKWITPCTQQ